MRYFEAPVLPEQRKKVMPHKIISGNWPGATQVRIGGDQNILIDGLNKRISVTTDDGTITFGLDAGGDTGLVINNGVTDFLKLTKDGLVMNDGSTEFMTLNASGMVFSDGTINVLTIDAEGMHFNDATDERMRVGVQPDASYNVVVTKPGEDIEQVF